MLHTAKAIAWLIISTSPARRRWSAWPAEDACGFLYGRRSRAWQSTLDLEDTLLYSCLKGTRGLLRGRHTEAALLFNLDSSSLKVLPVTFVLASFPASLLAMEQKNPRKPRLRPATHWYCCQCDEDKSEAPWVWALYKKCLRCEHVRCAKCTAKVLKA